MNKRSMRSKKNDWPFALARIYKLSWKPSRWPAQRKASSSNNNASFSIPWPFSDVMTAWDATFKSFGQCWHAPLVNRWWLMRKCGKTCGWIVTSPWGNSIRMTWIISCDIWTSWASQCTVLSCLSIFATHSDASAWHVLETGQASSLYYRKEWKILLNQYRDKRGAATPKILFWGAGPKIAGNYVLHWATVQPTHTGACPMLVRPGPVHLKPEKVE